MTRTVPSALLTHYQGDALTIAQCIKLTRADAQVFGFTSADRALSIDGVDYLPLRVDASALVVSSSMAVDNLELRIVPQAAGEFNRAELLTGVWDNAAWQLFEVNYKAVADGVVVLNAGRLGDFEPLQGYFVAEMRGLMQALQQPVGDTTQVLCRYRLGDARCTKDLAAFTYAASVVTAATSGNRRIFTASGRGEAAEWFTEGEITFTTGDNAGYRRKVKAFASGGVFELGEALPYEISVADEFTAIAGCRKRHIEDCKDKFSNILNFGGEPHLPGIDEITAAPQVSV